VLSIPGIQKLTNALTVTEAQSVMRVSPYNWRRQQIAAILKVTAVTVGSAHFVVDRMLP
jgi:hypothetical protein